MGQKEGEGVLGKYLLIEVPNFNNASGDDAMSSYLRLGAVKDPGIAASPSAPKASGEDLAARVTSFIDDTRLRDGCPDFIPEAERQAETARLHTKGGWRDHSDGNRITTTRGDKVEVIQGNYRMLVLGRQNDEAGWDVSGGHVAESGITFAGSSKIEWVQNYDGTWKVTEETVKGDVHTTYMGDVKDEYWGNLKTSTTGSAAPSAEKPNPDITDRTWARSIRSYTGSSALPIPILSDETWATSITSSTHADSISSSTEATSISDTTTAATITSTTTAAAILDTTIGNTVSVIVGSEAEIIVGNTAEVTVGLQESITVGGLLDITIALMIDVCIAGRLVFNAGPEKDLSPQKDEFVAAASEWVGTKIVTSGSWLHTSSIYKVMAANVELGL